MRVDCRQSNSLRKIVTNTSFIVYSIEITFFIEVIKISFTSFDKIFVINFDVNASKNIEIEYKFRDWTYAKEKCSLIENDEVIDVCFDTNVEIILIDEIFFRRQSFDVLIRKMITFLTIRDFDTNQHEISDYAICFMYFEENKDDISFKAMIRREIHLISHFKINMLIDNDVICFENIVIDSTNKKVYIDNCDVIVSIEIRSRDAQTQQRFIHARKTITLSSRNQLIISVHQLNDELFDDRDFFFESNDIDFILYAHLIDFFIKTILIFNDTNQIIKIFRNFRLNKLIEIDYSHVFHVDENFVKKLIVRHSKIIHQFSWFKKLIFVFITVVIAIVVVITSIVQQFIVVLYKSHNILQLSSIVQSIVVFKTTTISSASSICFECDSHYIAHSQKSCFSSIHLKLFFEEKFFTNRSSVDSIEIVMFNDVIIYQSIDIKTFVDIVEKFSTLWKNIEFVELSKKNWMRIFFKSNWKERVFDKAKIYLLKTRDKKLINKTFDELHELKRFNWTNEFIFFSYRHFAFEKSSMTKKKQNNHRYQRIECNHSIRRVFAISTKRYYSNRTKLFFHINNKRVRFFYQWRVYSKNRHKLTIVIHRNQKSFNVAMMNYKNSSIYVQRQINRLFRRFRQFFKIYVDDIIIFFKTTTKHAAHLRSMFDMLRDNNIFIKFNKTFLKYSFVQLFD